MFGKKKKEPVPPVVEEKKEKLTLTQRNDYYGTDK